MKETLKLDAVLFKRVAREIHPRGVEKLHIVKDGDTYMEKRLHAVTPSHEIEAILALQDGDNLLLVVNASDPNEQIIFISPHPELRTVVAQAIRQALHIKDLELRK